MIPNSAVAAVRSILLAVAVVAVVTPARAQQPSAAAIAMAKEIITAKGSAENFNSMLSSMIERAKSMLLQTNPMLSKDLNDVAAKLRKDYAGAAGEPLNEAAKLYASRFTEQELRAILTFYKTPTGKKVIVQEPQIFQESVRALDSWSAKTSEDILIKFRAEMRKRGHEL